jgi:hypothetical protein
MHPYDRYFFDGENYTVQKWLDDVDARYGGVDSVRQKMDILSIINLYHHLKMYK